MSEEAREFAENYGGTWGEHHKYLPSDWRREVEHWNTRQSYWDWVISKLDSEE